MERSGSDYLLIAMKVNVVRQIQLPARRRLRIEAVWIHETSVRVTSDRIIPDSVISGSRRILIR
jgi:hypothetical protein